MTCRSAFNLASYTSHKAKDHVKSHHKQDTTRSRKLTSSTRNQSMSVQLRWGLSPVRVNSWHLVLIMCKQGRVSVMFRHQLGTVAFQMWSDKEETESGESDSRLQKSSLFREVSLVFSLSRPLLVLVVVSSRFFHHLLALLIISSWYRLHVLVLSIHSSSPSAVFLIPEITAWCEWPPHALYCSSIWSFRYCSDFLPTLSLFSFLALLLFAHCITWTDLLIFIPPFFLFPISLYFCSVFCTISSTLFSNATIKVFLFYYIFNFKSYILSLEWSFFIALLSLSCGYYHFFSHSEGKNGSFFLCKVYFPQVAFSGLFGLLFGRELISLLVVPGNHRWRFNSPNAQRVTSGKQGREHVDQGQGIVLKNALSWGNRLKIMGKLFSLPKNQNQNPQPHKERLRTHQTHHPAIRCYRFNIKENLTWMSAPKVYICTNIPF